MKTMAKLGQRLINNKYSDKSTKHFLTFLGSTLILCTASLLRLMQRIVAPLRRIVARELEVFEYDRIRKDLPQSFIIQDHLECGHVEVCYSWDIFDLLNAYTTNPQVRAKRHRCKPCASLLADRKPVQPVRVAKAGAAKKQSPQFSWGIA